MLVSFLLLIFASGLFDLDFLGLWGFFSLFLFFLESLALIFVSTGDAISGIGFAMLPEDAEAETDSFGDISNPFPLAVDGGGPLLEDFAFTGVSPPSECCERNPVFSSNPSTMPWIWSSPGLDYLLTLNTICSVTELAIFIWE